MAAATARAPAANRRWGFAAAAAAAPTTTPAVGVPGKAPKPTNPPAQRGAFPWGDRPVPPAPNAWGSPSLLSLKNNGGSGMFGKINDRPSPGSSSTSTDGSDLLDSPLAWGRTSHNSTTVISHPQSTELRPGSWQFPQSQTSFSNVLKAPLKTVDKRRPTSHGKGFTLSADEFPVLVSKNSQSNSQLGHSFQRRPTFSSVIMAARDERRKIPTTGDPVSTTAFSAEAKQAQLHATQASDVCMPPPSIDYWDPPPDHPPDRNGTWHGRAASYGLCKSADTPGSLPVEAFTDNGGEIRHGPVHAGSHPENDDSRYAHVPADACVKSLHLPHLILGKVKDNHSDALEKQVIIKKDVALLEKIKLLNIKARKLRAGNMSEISLCRESKVEHSKRMDVKADHIANDVPVSAVIGDVTSALDMANPVSESIYHVPNGTSNVSAAVMIDLSEGCAIKFSEARKPGKYVDNHVYGVENTSKNKRGSSAIDTASNIWGHGWEEHSTVDSLPVVMTNTHEDQPFAGICSQQVHVRTADDTRNRPDHEIQNSIGELSDNHAKQLHEGKRAFGGTAKSVVKLEDLNMHSFLESQKSSGTHGKSYHVYRGGNASRNRHGSFADDISSNISGHGWEDHTTLEPFSVMSNTHQDQSFSWNTSRQVHVRTTDDMIDSSDYEIQHSRRELSAQHAKQLQEEERQKAQQKAKSISKHEDWNNRPLVQSQKLNDAPGKSSDSHEYGGWNASRNMRGGSAEDISFNSFGHGWEDHPAVDSLPVMVNSHQDQSNPWDTSQQVHVGTTDNIHNTPGYGIKHSRWRESSAQHSKELWERENIQQKATSIAKPENLNRRPFVHSQKPNDAHGRSADYNEYGRWNTSRNRSGPGHRWEDHPTVDSLPVMASTHQDQSFPENTSRQVHVRTADTLKSPGYGIQQSRGSESSPQHAKELQERENIQQKATFIAKPENLNRRPFVHGLKSNDAPGRSADYHEYGRWHASRNRHGSSFSAEDISFNMPGHGWEDHPTVDSLPPSTNTHQDQSFPGNTTQLVHARTADTLNCHGYEIQHSRRDLSSQHAKQLPEQEREKTQQNAKSTAKLEDLNRHRFVQSQNSDDAPAKSSDYNVYGGENTSGNRHGSFAEEIPFGISGLGWDDHPAVDSLPVAMANTHQDQSLPGNTAEQVHERTIDDMLNSPGYETQLSRRELSAQHSRQLQKQERGKLQPKAKANAKLEELNRSSRVPPASESLGVNKGSFIHSVMPSAKNNDINMREHIARRSALQSHENSAPKRLQMEIRRRQVRSEEGILRERSNIAESTENLTTVAGTLVDMQNAEAKPHADLPTQSENRRPASPLGFGTKNTEASSVHKVHISGVVINSAIIPVKVSSIRGFTVGSIMLGDASPASVNQEEKTVAKEVHDDVTRSCSSPKKTNQSGTNQHGAQHAKDPHGSDSIMHTPVKEPSKKEHSEFGGLNCTAIPAPTQPSGNQSIASQIVVPAKTSEMERHKPAYKELDLHNPRQMLPAENNTFSDNSATSKLDTKTVDKEALAAPTATKTEVKTEPDNLEDEKSSNDLARSGAGSNQGSTGGSASAAPDLNEQEANSLVLKVMEELSDQFEQLEKELKSSTYAATVNHLQPTRMVSLSGYTSGWGEHQVSRCQRQYHVDGQGNMWINHVMNSHMDGRVMIPGPALPTTHLLPGPISVPVPVPQNNVPGANSAPGWTWDVGEGTLISDMGDVSGPGTAITARSGAEPSQNVCRVGQMDLQVVQAVGGMAFGAAAAAGNPEVLHHAGPELIHQLNPAWFPHVQHDAVHHHGGTGVYLPGGASYMSGPMVGPVHPDYQLMPAVASSIATWSNGGAMMPAGHPAETWGAAYREHLYYA